MTDTTPLQSQAKSARAPEQVEREIEQTRAQLGSTVEALARKTDVKAQARRKLQDTKASVIDKRRQLADRAKQTSPESAASAASQASHKLRENPLPLAAAAALAAGFLAGRLTARSDR